MMKITNKLLLATAIALVVIGLAIAVVALYLNNWSFAFGYDSTKEVATHEINESIRDISINTYTADVIFIPTNDSEAKIVCRDANGLQHTVTVNDGALAIELTDTRKWYDYISFSFENSEIAIYLPSGEYNTLDIDISMGDVEIPKEFTFGNVDIEATTGDIDFCATATQLKIKTGTGDISLENVMADAIDLSTSTGTLSLSDINCTGELKLCTSNGNTSVSGANCGSLYSSGSTGDIRLTSLISDGKIDITRGTGDVEFIGCDAAEINVTTTTGNVTGSLLSDKIFMTHTGTGKERIPATTTGGICRIECSTGDIIIEIKK